MAKSVSGSDTMTAEEFQRWLQQPAAHTARRDLEHGEQVTLYEWAEQNVSRFPELALLHAIPNGGHRHVAVAVKMKLEGVKAGVPDNFLPVARSLWHGLYIEMKVKGGRVRDNQKWWRDALTAQGFQVVVAWSFEQAVQFILDYLALPLPKGK